MLLTKEYKLFLVMLQRDEPDNMGQQQNGKFCNTKKEQTMTWEQRGQHPNT